MMRAAAMIAVLCAFGAMARAAKADSITFEMDNVFNGSTTPSGTPKATLDDMGATGAVKFTLDLTDLGPSGEKIGAWYFNTTVNIAGLTLSDYMALSGAVTQPGLSYSFNSTDGAFKADGDGYFDLVLTFATSSGSAFEDGEKLSFILSFPGITASTFDAWSLPSGGGSGPFESALHIQGVGPTAQSLWLSGSGTPGDPGNQVPEPALAVLAALGIAGAILRRRAS